MTPQARINSRWDNFTLVTPGYDLIHSFNAVPILGAAPFIMTFEDYCPRVPPDRYNKMVETILTRPLLTDRCKAIIAISDYGLRKFTHQHRDHPQLAELLAKTRVIYPGICNHASRPKKANDRLKLLFVGKDFLRKGGPALVEAHKRLRASGIPVDTTIISALRTKKDCYVSPPHDGRVGAVRADMNSEGITLHEGLPHHEVMALMAMADYLLLPTLHDTFGYVSVEAMSVGTPVIASRTCAQPEIVEDGVSGHLLDMDNDPRLGDWRWLYRKSEQGYADAYWHEIDNFAGQLTRLLSRAWEQRHAYESMSNAAIECAMTRFGTSQLASALDTYYLAA